MSVSVQNREQHAQPQSWTSLDDMECDDVESSRSNHTTSMATSLSGNSIASSASSLIDYEPELSQSLGSVASLDLRTPLKPSQAANHFHEPSMPFVLQKHPISRQPATQAKGLLAEALAARKSSNPLDKSPPSRSLQLSPERLNQSPSSARIAASAAALSPSPLSRANKPKLSLSTINSSAFTRPNLPQTPGGTLFFGARDGAADGAPVSPFMPPTPLVATMMESELARGPSHTSDALLMPAQLQRPSATSSIAMARSGKPMRTPLKRHGSIGMSPLSRDFASVSVHSKSRSNEEAVTSSPTAHRTQDLLPSSPSSYKLASSYSPLSSSGKSLSDESSTLGSRRSSSSSSSVSSSSSKKYKAKEFLIGGSTDLIRSFSASRLKTNARTKTAPKSFNLSQAFPTESSNAGQSDVQQQELQPLSAPAMKISFVDAQDEEEQLPDSPAPISPEIEQLEAGSDMDTPTPNVATPDTSLLTPCAALRAPAMERSFSAPLPPPTVSARHLTDYDLHPRFAATYVLGDELGSGGFGFVVAANRVSDSLPVAVKFIFKDKVPAHGWVRDPKLGVIPMEAFVLKVVDHPGVVKFIDLFDDRNFFYLVMELHGSVWQPPAAAPEPAPVATSKGLLRPAPMQRRTSRDLFECIEQHNRLSEEQARWVFAQVVETVWHLDRIGISHRDIKDENCVVDADFNVKLIDFGSAVITDIRKPQPYFNRFFGTMTFASPEILQGKPYRAPHAEIWSLGVLLSILISGQCPFPDPTAAIKGKLSKLKGAWSKEAANLLLLCLEVDPNKRATIAEIRDHPWVHQAWRDRAAKLNQAKTA